VKSGAKIRTFDWKQGIQGELRFATSLLQSPSDTAVRVVFMGSEK